LRWNNSVGSGMSRPACRGNCAHGDAMLGNDPAAYDGGKCGCERCPNFTFCKVWAPPYYFDCHAGRCGGCNSQFAKDLEIRPAGPDETCPICLDTCPVMIEHPAECGHATCTGCFEAQWGPPEEAEWHAPEEFGFAACCTSTDDCVAPRCTYYAQLHAWAQTEAGGHYIAANELREREWDAAQESVADPASCPLCRAHVSDAPSNSWDMRTFMPPFR